MSVTALPITADVAQLNAILRPLVPDAWRPALVERLLAAVPRVAVIDRTDLVTAEDPVSWQLGSAIGPGLLDVETRTQAAAVAAATVRRVVAVVLADWVAPVAGEALDLHWPPDVAPQDVADWLDLHAPEPGRAATLREALLAGVRLDRGALDAAWRAAWGVALTEGVEAVEPYVRRVGSDWARACLATLTAHAFRAWRAMERDRARKFVALDAGAAHHAMLGAMRDLPKSPQRQVTTTQRDGWAEILHPNQQLSFRLDVRDLPVELVQAIQTWRSWQGLRHWAALQCLFTDAGRTGRVRWTLDGHLTALGYGDRTRRDPAVRNIVAAEVEAITRMQVAVYHPDGTERARGPVLAVTQRGEALRGSEWTLEGLELMIHPALYEGVRQSNGAIGRSWVPAPVELARIDHARHPYALALGLILPIRWRWDTADGRDHIALTGERLLATAGIPRTPTNPARAWATLARNLEALHRIGGLGTAEWTAGEENTLDGVCRLYPPQWVRERLVHGIAPAELPVAPLVLTGGELAAWRTARGWSQGTAAAALGVARRTIIRAEAAPAAPLSRSIRAALEGVSDEGCDKFRQTLQDTTAT